MFGSRGSPSYDRHWAKRRAVQLAQEPLCKMCLDDGALTPATVADHITPHRGDARLFYGPLQSLCKRHHDSHKRQSEVRGFGSHVGSDGFPSDPAHPWYTGRREKEVGKQSGGQRKPA